MNREIKFRIIHNGRMIYPCFQTTPEYVIGWNGGLYYVDEDCIWDGEDEFRTFYLKDLPDATIIMQYTGLKDKHGNEIYEGDIIESEGTGPYVVQWFDCLSWESGGSCAVGFYLKDPHSSMYDDGELEYHLRLAIRPERLLILGNIYQNPELLKGTQYETKAVD